MRCLGNSPNHGAGMMRMIALTAVLGLIKMCMIDGDQKNNESDIKSQKPKNCKSEKEGARYASGIE